MIALEQRRFIEPAFAVQLRSLAAQTQACTFGQRVGYQAFYHGQLLGGGHRAHFGAFILRIADPDPTGAFGQAFHEFVVDFVLHQQSRAGNTALPGRRIDAGDGAIDGAVQVGVGEDDVG